MLPQADFMAINKYHLGCTGWSQKEWVGTFFRDDARPDHFLQQYASVFNAVEGNTTFYHIPNIATIRKWGKQTADGFKFCFKFHRSITHQKMLKKSDEDISNFLKRFEPIRNRLGPFMIQLPSRFSSEHIGRLEETLATLPTVFSYAVEVRHPDFFDQGKKEKQLNRLLESYNVDRIIFDTRKLYAMKSSENSIKAARREKPKVPARFITTSSRPMVRFVGANEPIANESYLKEWAIIVADWIKEGLHPYVFIHSPDRVSQPVIARYFHQMLTGLTNINPMPTWPAEGQDKQLDLF